MKEKETKKEEVFQNTQLEVEFQKGLEELEFLLNETQIKNTRKKKKLKRTKNLWQTLKPFVKKINCRAEKTGLLTILSAGHTPECIYGKMQ